jgi:mannose-1-phosphate guanylyltransferase
LTAVVGDGADLGVRVRYSWEQPRVLGSAGGPRQALPLLEEDPLLIVNGDTLTDLALDGLARAHEATGARVTLALVPNREYERYGGVVLDGEQRVTGFVRRGPVAKGSFHFIGVQLANRSVFRPLPAGEPINSIGQVYDALIAAEIGSVRGFVGDAEFWDVGTVDDYWRTSNAFARKEGRGDVLIGRAASIDPTARIRRSILWDDVEVGANAVIEDCILTDGARVSAGAVHRHAIIHAQPQNH